MIRLCLAIARTGLFVCCGRSDGFKVEDAKC